MEFKISIMKTVKSSIPKIIKTMNLLTENILMKTEVILLFFLVIQNLNSPDG
jgi:hypothetical protein